MKTIKLTLVLFLTVLLFSRCKKDSAKNDNTNTTNAEYYFKGTLNGTALNWQVNDALNTWVEGSSATLSNDQGNISGGITALISAGNGFQPQFGIEFKTYNKPAADDYTTVFSGFVKTGSWAYSTNASYAVGTKAIVIYYLDASGKEYTSVGGQSGSTANVITITPIAASLGRNDAQKIKLTFNCTLYPADGTGAALNLTNAEATVFLEDLLGS
jgi:hypothetical protein